MTDRNPTEVVDLLAELFAEQGGSEYFGEAVTQAEHPVQRARSTVIAHRRFCIPLQWLSAYIPFWLDSGLPYAPCASLATGERSPGRTA